MENNRDNFKPGKKQFSRNGSSGNNNFNAKGGNFKRNDRNFNPKKSSNPNYSNNSGRPERTGSSDRFNKPGEKSGYSSNSNNAGYKRDGGFNRTGGKPNYSSSNNNSGYKRSSTGYKRDSGFKKPGESPNYSSSNNNTGYKRDGEFNKFKKSDNFNRNDRGDKKIGSFNRNNTNDRNDRFDRKPKFDRFKSFDKPAKFGSAPDKLNRPIPEKIIEKPITSVVEKEDSGMVYGRNAVIELLKSGKSIDKLFVQSGQREGSITMIFAEAVKKSIPIIEVEKNKLDSMINNSAHQGVIAMASEKEYCSAEDILKIAEERNEKPFILIADKIMDPHNLGAIIRTAECAGVHGIIIPKRHSAGISPIVAKTSAGASIHMAVAKVANIANTIEELQEKGLWVYSSSLDSNPDNSSEKDKKIKDYNDADYSMPLALVVGNEGEGLSPIVIQKSDFLVKIPLFGKIESLNVSCASAILMYEISRQRKQK